MFAILLKHILHTALDGQGLRARKINASILQLLPVEDRHGYKAAELWLPLLASPLQHPYRSQLRDVVLLGNLAGILGDHRKCSRKAESCQKNFS
jgi:hypothetical protein